MTANDYWYLMFGALGIVCGYVVVLGLSHG
jgi:hypothetical protein